MRKIKKPWKELVFFKSYHLFTSNILTDDLEVIYKTVFGLRSCSWWSTFKWCFSSKLETVQYNAALVISGAIKGTSREKLYQELGREYLQQRRWMRRLCLFHKVVSTKIAACIYDFIPPVRQSQRHPNTLNSFSFRTKYFKNSFFPSVIGEWNKVSPDIRSSGSYNMFRTNCK